MIKILLVIITAALVAACLPKNAFAPPPDEYETWIKQGASELDVWKAMLGCGFASPFRVMEAYPGGERSDEQIAASMRCMEGIGYRQYEQGRPSLVCDGWRSRLMACTSDAAVRKPDVDVRLNSGYCKKYPQSRACVP